MYTYNWMHIELIQTLISIIFFFLFFCRGYKSNLLNPTNPTDMTGEITNLETREI